MRPRKLAAPSAIVTVKPETLSPDFRVSPSRATSRLAALAVAVCAAPIAIDLTYQPLAGGLGSIRYEPDGKFRSVKDPFASATPRLTLFIVETGTSEEGVVLAAALVFFSGSYRRANTSVSWAAVSRCLPQPVFGSFSKTKRPSIEASGARVRLIPVTSAPCTVTRRGGALNSSRLGRYCPADSSYSPSATP